jgi:hypothetical protein
MMTAYKTIHQRRTRQHGSPSGYLCEGCCGNKARDFATIHPVEEHEGNMIFIDFVPLCRSCHLKYDDVPARREGFAGRQHSDSTKALMSQVRKGVPKSAETRQRMVEGWVKRRAHAAQAECGD